MLVSKKITTPRSATSVIALLLACISGHAADVTWNGAVNNDWATGGNWSNTTGPATADAAYIHSGTVEFSTGATPSLNALRLLGGTLTFSGGIFNCINNSNAESHIDGTLNHTGTDAKINELEIGRTAGSTGLYTLSGGSLKISRQLAGISLYLGANKAAVSAGTGTLEISGGSFTTRSGVKLGDAALAGTGKFTVLGSVIDEIGIGTANNEADGTWKQHSGSILKLGVDNAGIRKIFIKDNITATTGTSATFEAGSLLDVGYYNGGSGGGTWTVMEVENGPVINNGLGFAPGVNASIWSIIVDNSGPNGLLKVTASGTVPTGNAIWTGATNSVWETATNWTNNTAPVAGDFAYITYGTSNFSTGTSVNLKGLRLWGGKLSISGGSFSATSSTTAESHVDATLDQSGGSASFNELEIGSNSGRSGLYQLRDGSLNVTRTRAGNSLYLGGNRQSENAGTGRLEISGGSFNTRGGVKLGDASKSGTGQFTVLGSSISKIGIGSSTGDTDGAWLQHGGSTLKVGVDFGGVTPIFIDDSSTGTTGTSAIFENGSRLDVGYYNGGYGGGTWTVMEVENGSIIDNGLSFASGVDTAIWTFSIDNSGPNGLLKITAAGTPAGYALNVGNTKKQKMRYGLDYERLWYWYGSTSNKNTVARWSMVDCDVDYIRVAINSEYELNEGTYNLSAYTDKIIPMMQAMKAAKPDIKFFASPRPLNEAVSNAKWQPYPIWITGASSYTSSSFNFNWQKCAEYLLRYINLMKSYGFKISFMDLTNEWNYVDAGDVRDIKAYLQANLAAEDVPLMVAPSAWSYYQGSGWLSGANSTAKKAAIDIASCHNTDRTGTAQDFADKVESIWPGQGKEIWNTEVHGWKSTSGEDEVTSSYYMFEAIRAGFSGLNGWLAIGTTDQGHSYILNDGSNVTRNVKYFIFKKLSTTSNYGNALDINQPTQLKSTVALIRGNLMTVWVVNTSANSVPVIINPSGRTFSETTVKRTKWNESLAVEGITDQIPTTTNNSVWSTIAGNSTYCFEILLDPLDHPFTRIEAEGFNQKSGMGTETCNDAGGTLNLNNINHGTWSRYDNIAPGSNAVMRFRVARPAGRKDGWIEVRLDSPTGDLIGKVAVPETGGWQTYQTIETTLQPVQGTRSIYLNFVEVGSTAGTSLFNLNWFSLTQPQAPGGLTATPASRFQINLTWSAMPNATSYNLKRSITSGGPYTTVASGLTSTSRNDTGLITGTRYYYVVSAEYSGDESVNSPEVSAVTQSDFPTGNAVLWTGAASAIWDTSALNWSNSGAGTYTNGDIARFGDTGGANLSISLSSAVTPASVSFIDTGAGTNAYTFDNSAINGSGSLTLASGFGGSVQLNVANGYSGGTTVQSGTLRVGNDGSLGSGTLTLAGGTFTNSAAATIGNALNVTGTSSLYTSSGNLFINGDISGSGTLNTGGTGNGQVSGTVVIADNLDGFTGTITHESVSSRNNTFFTGVNTTAKFSISGAASANRALRFNSDSTIGGLSGTGGVVQGANAKLTINQSTDTTFAGNLDSNLTVVKSGPGTLTLTYSNTYTGGTAVTAGILSAENNKALGNTSLLTVNGGNLHVRGIAAGTLTLGTGADFVLSSGVITLDIGTLSDQIVGNGAGSDFTISGGTIVLTPGAGFDYGNTYTVLSNFGGTNTVSGLTITGITGYTAELSTTGVLSFTPIAGAPYNSWALGTFTHTLTNIAPGDDFDNDGLSNLLEFVFGGDPTINQAGIAPAVSVSGSNLLVTFRRSDISKVSPATTVTAQVSEDLNFSTPGNAFVIGNTSDPGPIGPLGASYTVSNGGGFDTVVVSIPRAAIKKGFIRVVAIQP